MTPDETKRLTVLELKVEYLEAQAERHDKRIVAAMDKLESQMAAKLDTLTASLQTLLDASNVGKGAWLAMVKLGAFIIGLTAIIAAVTKGALWLLEKIKAPL